MAKRIPDELFRSSGAAESADVGGASNPSGTPLRRTRAYLKTHEVRQFAPPMVVAGVIGALLLGFGVGKLVSIQSEGRPSTEPIVSAVTSMPTVMPSPESTLAPWSGPVRVVPALDASGRCLDGMGITTDLPANLVDGDPDSLWRCSGAGVGETITFDLEGGEELVGVRLVNGNTSSYDRYLAERRILLLKWEFSDGSWVVQPLAANDRENQEVRFPPITVTGEVTMTVLDATVPGDTSGEDGDAAGRNDAVSISSLQFLGVA